LVTQFDLITDEVHIAGFSPDGKVLVTLGTTLSLWNIEQNQLISHLVDSDLGYSTATNVTFSPDGKFLAGASEGGWLTIWSAYNGEELIRISGDGSPAYCTAFSPDGNILVAGYSNGIIRILEVNSWKTLKVLDASSYNDVFCLAFSPDGKILASASYDLAAINILPDAIVLWDIQSGTRIKSLEVSERTIHSIEISSEGKFLVALLLTKAEETTIGFWDLDSLTEFRTLNSAYKRNVNSIAFLSKEALLASGCEDGSIVVYNLKTNGEILTVLAHDNKINVITYDPNRHILASIDSNALLKLWQVITLE
jgi:WD40 repeat protein